MTKEDLINIKKHGRWRITLQDAYSKFFFILFPLGIVVVGAFAALSGFKNNVVSLKICSIIILMTGFFLTFFVGKKLYQNQIFQRFQIHGLTQDKIEITLKRAGFNNIKYYSVGYYTATTNMSGFSWGEEVTIIFDDDYILVNSRPNGNTFSFFQPFTIFKDRHNIKKITDGLT
ncbi:hypothetical protein [Parafilimonas terrae]|uniref:Uncharacterized protein n=1 Tax=Parafilimonas terrae TaxID=1465490 RepID=A0A1I5YA83_9BACT|nr:hypothetical protein [Parafilimonas terrae]SFQ41108.1 hypothetical protein SAMN05444277_11158 [Parafilimonas terrae]